MKEADSTLDFASIRAYMRNTNVFFEGIESGFVDRACKKSLAILSQLFASRCRPVFSERIIEYSLLFQYLPRESQEILELGCVEGVLPIQLCSLGHSVTGIDFRPYPFRHRNFDFVQADILTWEPMGERFDAAISISTIEHLGLGAYGDPTNPEGDKMAVMKLQQSLKKGGRLLLTVPAGRSCVERGARIYDPDQIQDLVSEIEVIRFFLKPERYGDWEETSSDRIATLTYENYQAIVPIQGMAFVVSRKS